MDRAASLPPSLSSSAHLPEIDAVNRDADTAIIDLSEKYQRKPWSFVDDIELQFPEAESVDDATRPTPGDGGTS